MPQSFSVYVYSKMQIAMKILNKLGFFKVFKQSNFFTLICSIVLSLMCRTRRHHGDQFSCQVRVCTMSYRQLLGNGNSRVPWTRGVFSSLLWRVKRKASASRSWMLLRTRAHFAVETTNAETLREKGATQSLTEGNVAFDYQVLGSRDHLRKLILKRKCYPIRDPPPPPPFPHYAH